MIYKLQTDFKSESGCGPLRLREWGDIIFITIWLSKVGMLFLLTYSKKFSPLRLNEVGNVPFKLLDSAMGSVKYGIYQSYFIV